MEIVLDACYLGEKEAAHEYLAEMLDFPEYYGKNLDALHDCLCEMDELTLYIINSEDAGDYFDKLLPVFRDACQVRLI